MPAAKELANAIRALSMDAVQKANSGHPGMPMGMADIAEVLWNDFLIHNPNNATWANRDRFILSNGHGCMLHYSLLHLTGYDVTLEDIKQFRQLHSKTPGHPEYGATPGVETTTGPLGQGLAAGVGMAIAEKSLAKQFNRPEANLIDHHTYVFAGDGCLMEGISHEACSLAGTLGLGKLIVFYDDNGISIDGEVDAWFTDDTPKRFAAYGWQVIPQIDGHNREAIKQAITAAQAEPNKPTLICCKTVIGFGAPNLAGTSQVHGAPLGEAEVAAAREKLGWSHPAFYIPDEIYAAWSAKEKGAALEAKWQQQFTAYQAKHPELAAELTRRLQGKLPDNWQAQTQAFIQDTHTEEYHVASRKASQQALNAYGPLLPELIGGSADLTGSNCTLWSDAKALTKEHPDGNYIYYGVREFAMSAITNGLSLHGGFIPYSGTFLVFLDYARNAVRLAALMGIRNIFVYSHDSIGLGEDGPTHQPIEHLTMLRATPNISVWRPCDAVESAVAWQQAIEREDGPSALLFSRQTLPHQDRSEDALANIKRGGYILRDCDKQPEVILIATGSEVALAMQAAEQLTASGKQVRVVSMPSTEVFAAQKASYQESVLPKAVTARVVIEAGASICWHQYVGAAGKIIGLDHFGESAPAKVLYETFGFSVDNIIKTVNELA